MQHYVAGFLFSPDMTKVVLIKKNKPKWMKGFLNAVGGKQKPYEFSDNAQRREFLEEAGVDIPEKDWELFCVLNGTSPDFQVCFYRTVSEKYKEVKTMESEEIGIYNVSEVSQLETLNNLKWLLPLATDNYIEFPVIVNEK